jgi:hypothetical protein
VSRYLPHAAHSTSKCSFPRASFVQESSSGTGNGSYGFVAVLIDMPV